MTVDASCYTRRCIGARWRPVEALLRAAAWRSCDVFGHVRRRHRRALARMQAAQLQAASMEGITVAKDAATAAASAPLQPAVLHPAALMRLITATRSVHELDALWQQQHLCFNVRHLSAALLQLARCSDARCTDGSDTSHTAHSLAAAMLQQVRARLSYDVDCCCVANTLLALGKLRHRGDTETLHELLDVAANSLPAFSMPQLAAMIRGLALLGMRPSSAWRLAFYAATMQHAVLGLDLVDAQQGGQGTHRHVTSLGYTESNNIATSKVQQQQQQHIEKEEEEEAQVAAASVAGCMWALSQMGCRPPPGWMLNMLLAVDVGRAGSREVAGLLSSVARLQYCPPARWTSQVHSATLQQLERQVVWQSQHQRAACPPAQRWAWDRARLLQLGWGLAALRQPVPLPWCQAWSQALLPQLRKGAPPRELVMLLQVLSTLRVQCEPAPGAKGLSHRHGQQQDQSAAVTLSFIMSPDGLAEGAAIKSLLQHALVLVHGQLQECSMREVVLCLLYCARLGVRPHPAFLVDALRHLLRHLPSATALDLGHLAFSLARLRVRPPQHVAHHLVAASQRLVHTCSPQELANLCWGMAHIRRGQLPSRWLLAVCEAVHVAVKRFTAREVNQLCWALPRLLAAAGYTLARTHPSSHIMSALHSLADACTVPQLKQAVQRYLQGGDLASAELPAAGSGHLPQRGLLVGPQCIQDSLTSCSAVTDAHALPT